MGQQVTACCCSQTELDAPVFAPYAAEGSSDDCMRRYDNHGEEDLDSLRAALADAFITNSGAHCDKGSDLLTHEQLVERLADNRGSIHLDVIETIIDPEYASEPAVLYPSASHRDTCYVTSEHINTAKKRVSIMEFEEEQVPERTTNQKRKGTVFLTKERLLQALKDVDSDDEELAPRMGKVPSDIPHITGAEDPEPRRNRERRVTGFVTKGKLKKVLDVVGDD